LNSREAQQILLLYRPGTKDADDPQIAEALALARQDPALREWLEAHKTFQVQVREKMRGVPMPADLKERILAERKIIRLHRWQQPAWLAAAAVVILLAVLSLFLLGDRRPDKFADYRDRMVRAALRNYKMDILSRDLQQVKSYSAQKGGPVDYTVPQALNKLPVTGGGVLNWRGHPVSMVCFDRGQQRMMFLFVIDKSALKKAPSSEAPELATVNRLPTASWTANDKAYMLAGEESTEALKNYLK
jgi:uncharacterized membrane protein YbaN (DUF454 family)